MSRRIEELEAEYLEKENARKAERTKNKKDKKSKPPRHDED